MKIYQKKIDPLFWYKYEDGMDIDLNENEILGARKVVTDTGWFFYIHVGLKKPTGEPYDADGQT